MQIFIQPSDVLLFRDGRPFSAGEGHRARSLFPPTPNTMQGVIRSKVLADRCGRYEQYKRGCENCPEQEGCTIPAEIGRPAQNGQGNYGLMHLKGAMIARYERSQLTTYFPIPADVVQIKDKQSSQADVKLVCLSPLHPLPGQTDFTANLLPLWSPEAQPVEAAIGYWTHSDLENYLLGEQPQHLTRVEELFQKESRFGIEVDNGLQTVKEGRLYQTEFIRCCDSVGLYVEIEGIQSLSTVPDPEVGLMAIGGENRVASYTKVIGIEWTRLKAKLKAALPQAVGFKLYLATPTVFEQGWLPQWIDPNTLTGQYPDSGLSVKLVAAAIQRYQTIGGWDIAYNRHKPTRRAVSAGSVYYFTTDASIDAVIDAFHWKNLVDDPLDAQIGYGLGLVGIWNHCNL